MIASLRLDGISALMTVDGGVKGDDFYRFVRSRLVPTLRPGDVVVWDNINIHKSARIVAAIEEAGATIVRIPPYSPDLNPIEAAWSKVKALIRSWMPESVATLKEAMRRALRRIRASDALGWFLYCGYALPSQ